MRAKRRIAHSHLSVVAASVVVLSLVMGESARLVFAGTAPPTRSPGAAIAPDPSSAEAVNVAGSVTLVSQTVEFVVEPPPAVSSDAEVNQVAKSDQSVRARVNSSYVLRNSGRAEQLLSLGFPLNDLSGIKDGNGNLPIVDDFSVEAGGVPLSHTLTSRTNPYGEGEPAIQWATFPVVLPARGEVAVGTGFTTTATGQWPIAQFNYSLETASAWRGNIGSSVIMLRLPYTATAENVFLSDSTFGGVIDGADVRWTRRNLVATNQNNFQVSILAPKIWQQIVAAREVVQLTPTISDAWVTLGRAYRAAIALDNGVALGGTRQFVPLAEQVYEKAIELNPNVAEVHQEYAQLIYDLRIAEDLNTVRALPQLEKIVDHVQTALQLDPSNPATASLLLNVKQLVQDLAARQPLAAVTTLLDQITAIEAMVVVSTPAEMATVVPEITAIAIDTVVVTDTTTSEMGVVPTMSVEEEVAVVAAQSTVAASSALTTTPSASEAAAIVGAAATVGARETVVAMASNVISGVPEIVITETSIAEPVVVTAEATADAALIVGTPRSIITTTTDVVGAASTSTPATGPQTLVARLGLLAVIGIACGVIVVLGILAAILVALFGRRRVADSSNKKDNNLPPSSGSSSMS